VQTKKHGRKLCVRSSCSWSSYNNFQEQAFGLFTKIIISLRSTIGFVSNFKQFNFRRCKMFFQNFNNIKVVARELHLLKVKGV
jgi:hypothetical protein